MESDSDSETEFVTVAEETVHTRAHRTPQKVKSALEKARAVKAQKAQAKKAVKDLQVTTTKAKALASKSRTQALKAQAMAIKSGLVVPEEEEDDTPNVVDMILHLKQEVERLSKPTPAPIVEPPINTIVMPEPVPTLPTKPKAKRAPKPKPNKIEITAAPTPSPEPASFPPIPMNSFSTRSPECAGARYIEPFQVAKQQRLQEQEVRLMELKRRLGRI